MKNIWIILLSILVGCATPLDSRFDNKVPVYNRITIEIVSTPGCEPDPKALESFKEKLLIYHIAKEISVKEHSDPLNDLRFPFMFNGIWNSVSLKHFESFHCQCPTSKIPHEMNLFIVYIPGTYIDGKLRSLAGIQYNGSSFAIFKQNVNSVEASVLLHEFGHILGIASDEHNPDRKPANPDRPDHCSNTKCVMFWTVSEEATDFDDACRKEILKLFEAQS